MSHFQFLQLFTSIFEGQTQIVTCTLFTGASFQELISFAEFCNDQRIMGDLELSQKLKAGDDGGTNDDRGIWKTWSFSDDQLLLTCWIKSKIQKPSPLQVPIFCWFFQNPQRYSIICYLKTATYLLWWGYMSTYFYRVFLRIFIYISTIFRFLLIDVFFNLQLQVTKTVWKKGSLCHGDGIWRSFTSPGDPGWWNTQSHEDVGPWRERVDDVVCFVGFLTKEVVCWMFFLFCLYIIFFGGMRNATDLMLVLGLKKASGMVNTSSLTGCWSLLEINVINRVRDTLQLKGPIKSEDVGEY